MALEEVLNMITMTPVVRTPIDGTRLWVELVGVSAFAVHAVRVAPEPRRTQGGVDLYNSTGVSARAERLLR